MALLTELQRANPHDKAVSSLLERTQEAMQVPAAPYASSATKIAG
jgi:hypothetical protein